MFAGLLYRIESKFPLYALHNYIGESSHTYMPNNNYNLINDIKLNGSNNFKNINNNEINNMIKYENDKSDLTASKSKLLSISTIENAKILNETNYETNNFIYDNTSCKNGLRMSNWKQRINDEDADSGRLTLVSPPPSTFSTIIQPQLNYNSSNFELENINIFSSRSANTNSSPLSGLGTISTSSNNSTQTCHNSLLLRYDDANSSYEPQFYNNGKNEFANIRRGSQSIINAAMRVSINHSINYYDSILTKSTGNPAGILLPKLNKDLKLNKNLSESLSNSNYKPKNYRTSAVQFQKQEENKMNGKYMMLNGNQAPLKFNLSYNDKIITKNKTPLETDTSLLVTNKVNKNTILNNKKILNISENDLTTLCLKTLNQNNTPDFIKKTSSDNNYFKTQSLEKNIQQLSENEINENFINTKSLNKNNGNDEKNHPIVSVV